MSTDITTTNGNGWKPRQLEKWTCPSGQEVWTRQPGPEFTLRFGRTPQALAGGETSIPERKEGQTDEEYSREVMEHISDDELVSMARDLIVAMVESPKLVLNPKPELGEIGPDDTGIDFWPLYQYGMKKYFTRNTPIKVGDGEVEVEDLETFREESGVSGDSVDGAHVSVAESEPATTDHGLVSSDGAGQESSSVRADGIA